MGGARRPRERGSVQRGLGRQKPRHERSASPAMTGLNIRMRRYRFQIWVVHFVFEGRQIHRNCRRLCLGATPSSSRDSRRSYTAARPAQNSDAQHSFQQDPVSTRRDEPARLGPPARPRDAGLVRGASPQGLAKAVMSAASPPRRLRFVAPTPPVPAHSRLLEPERESPQPWSGLLSHGVASSSVLWSVKLWSLTLRDSGRAP
jgi:hypothetical protein